MSEEHHNSLLGKIAAYTEILSQDPRSTIFVSLSETYRKMGMLEEAYSVAEKGLGFLPDYSPGHVVLARIKCQQGDNAGSAKSFQRALDVDPESLAALVGYSRLYLLQDKQEEARKLLLRARNLSPADPVINKLLLSLPEPIKQPDAAPQALPTFDKALKSVATKPSEPLESATLAELYLKQGMADKALEIFRNLLLRDPDNLILRRRIRDLESTASSEIERSALPEITRNEFATPARDSLTGMNSQADDSSRRGKLSALDQFNRLLVSIQKRRGDV